MNMLAPLFLGGLLLIAIPYIVHQIRRPNYKKMRFSSLMFVPDVRKTVNERRKIQHPLLMLLRMLMLALLAFAFTRPFYETERGTEPDAVELSEHVIMIDLSYSMQAGTLFSDAKGRVLDVLEGLGTKDRVGLVMFDRTARVVAPLSNPGDEDAGSVGRANAALRGLEPGWNTTDFRSALQMAEGMFPVRPESDAGKVRQVIHVISDFQNTGMPEGDAGWKLRSDIELDPIAVGSADLANLSLDDVSLETLDGGKLRIRGKVRNWNYPDGVPVTVRLMFGQQEAATEKLTIRRGHSRQVVFTVTPPEGGLIEGSLMLDGDTLAADDRRYFTWQPPVKTPVLVVNNAQPGRGSLGGEVVRIAMTGSGDLPWEIQNAEPAEFGRWMAGNTETAKPEIVVLLATEGINEAGAAQLRAFMESGGQVIWMMQDETEDSSVVGALLGTGGWQLEGRRFETARRAQFQTLGWIDFGHEVFKPFRGERHNDFTGMHFYNFLRLGAAGNGEPAGRVMARFEDGSPAMMDLEVGKGRLMVWTFPVELDWTNLPKKAAFVPLLHESLGAMTRKASVAAEYTVGAMVRPPVGLGKSSQWEFMLPGSDTAVKYDPNTDRAPMVDAPGYVRWRPEGQSEWISEAVNLNSMESDPTRIGATEFAIRLSQDPEIPAVDATATEGEPAAELNEAETIRNEYGLWVLVGLLLFLLLETGSAIGLAAKIRRQQESEA